MKRFNAEYKVGQTVEWQGRRFVIEEIKPVDTMTNFGAYHGLAAYLKEI